VGANREAVLDGVTGFHAASVEEWASGLARLIESPALRAQQGERGHAHVIERYDMARYQRRYLELLNRLAVRP
jgi:glycosyltransferase involved in cell wall biosynthesis